MIRYKNLSGNSGVISYEILSNGILVTFRNGTYKYTNRSIGHLNITRMKKLAEAGRGLSTFIAKYGKENYESKY